MTEIDEKAPPRVAEAAGWLLAQTDPPRLVVPALRAKFGISAKEACEAIALARFKRIVFQGDVRHE